MTQIRMDVGSKQEIANQARDIYIKTLYDLLPILDLSIGANQGKAHGILNMIAQIQELHATLENPAPAREERVEAYSQFRGRK